MSFARFALRASAVRALRGATLVGDNVRDSDFGAIDIAGDGSLRTDQDRPFVLVYTDDGEATETDLRSLRQNGAVDFVCEFGIAAAMTVLDEETGASHIAGISMPPTDANFELTLDMIDRQIVAALTGQGVWAEIWRRLSLSVTKIERRRAAASDEGMRLAARQMRVRLDLLPDPVAGQPMAPGAVWADFVAAITAEDAVLGDVAASFLGGQDTALTYDMLRAGRGHTEAEGRALGYGPFHPGHPEYLITDPRIETDV
ncbi:hypothetical protein [Limimaricola hongkongensis]|uniref:Uncharacterized protein n=1 Tax=Limimaricola hongkongensis DSM 17492 TaxID=1122180 RepID=A0A017HBB6_9RHOB|nr:hypothetical protein [Limimaricola hongkongensis]EYD71807.1 hypothetical protein Lokhon_01877 [Limimaricola hongkongensis DSM 17492]